MVGAEEIGLEVTAMGRRTYNHAVDLIQSWAGSDENGAIIPRSGALKIIEGFAEALGLSKEQLCEKLSEHFMGDVIEDLKRTYPSTNPQKAKGGYARAKSLSPERRKEIASNAARTRWKDNLKGSLLLDDQDDYKGADYD